MARPVGVQLHVHSEAKGLGRNELGQFRNQAQVRQINREMAVGAQADVVDAIESRIKRRSVSTGRLATATASSDNVYSDNVGFGVGIPSVLDHSVAKYWRQIEEGTDVHVGQEITGVWGESKAGFYASSWGTALRGGTPYTAHGAGVGGKFVPLAKTRWVMNSGGGRLWGKATVIKQPIEAMHAYKDTFEQGGWFSDKPLSAALEYLQDVVRASFSFE